MPINVIAAFSEECVAKLVYGVFLVVSFAQEHYSYWYIHIAARVRKRAVSFLLMQQPLMLAFSPLFEFPCDYHKNIMISVCTCISNIGFVVTLKTGSI